MCATRSEIGNIADQLQVHSKPNVMVVNYNSNRLKSMGWSLGKNNLSVGLVLHLPKS